MSSKKHILASIILLSSCLISCGKKETLSPVSDGIILSEENAKADYYSKSGSHYIKCTLSSLDTPFAPPLF